jgi:hypothetical protein
MARDRVEQLYNDTARVVGAANYNMIEVMDANVHAYPDDPKNRELTQGQQTGFRGILQNNFTYNVNADWEAKLANINLPGAGKVIKALTGDTSRTGIFTEKFYQGASYLVINPKFRVVDWDGDGIVIQNAVKVINKLLPLGNNKTVSETYGDVSTLAGELKSNLRENIGTSLVTTLADPVAAAKNVVNDTVDAAIGVANKYLWGEPEPVRIKIGNFFDMNNMILESASIEFSKEMTRNGPLYADFECQFSSKLALVKHQTGLIARDGNGQQVRIRGTFAEDRAFPRAEAERFKRYQQNWQPVRIEESWGLSKINELAGRNVVGDTIERIVFGE